MQKDVTERLLAALNALSGSKNKGLEFNRIDSDQITWLFEILSAYLEHKNTLAPFYPDIDRFGKELEENINEMETFLKSPWIYGNTRVDRDTIETSLMRLMRDASYATAIAILSAYASRDRLLRVEINQLWEAVENFSFEISDPKNGLKNSINSSENRIRITEGEIAILKKDLENLKSIENSKRAVEITEHAFGKERKGKDAKIDAFKKRRDWAFRIFVITILLPISILILNTFSIFLDYDWITNFHFAVVETGSQIGAVYLAWTYTLLVVAAYLNVHFATNNYFHYLKESDFYLNREVISDSFNFFSNSINSSEFERGILIGELVKRVFEPNQTNVSQTTSGFTTPFTELIKTVLRNIKG